MTLCYLTDLTCDIVQIPKTLVLDPGREISFKFSRYVVMEFLKCVGKCLYVGFLDFEKTFDFNYRANIIENLKETGAGSKFIKAVASMNEETVYISKLPSMESPKGGRHLHRFLVLKFEKCPNLSKSRDRL